MKALIVIGFSIVGYMGPEILRATSPHKLTIPTPVKLATMLALGLISAGVLYQ